MRPTVQTESTQRPSDQDRAARRLEALTDPRRKLIAEIFGPVIFLEPELD